MAVNLPIWERRLIDLAQQGEPEPGRRTEASGREHRSLAPAYRRCEELTARHSRSFHLASRFLPQPKRRAIRALYAFCRVTDNIADRPGPDAHGALRNWQARTLGQGADSHDPVVRAWKDTRQRFRIPEAYAQQLIEGVGQDLGPVRYDSFEALAHYCYGVASTVGLMSMHIIGFRDRKALPYAVKLGVALQLTNILRDVGEDLAQDRLYLPGEELAAHGLRRADLAAGRVDERWRRFMRFQIERARRLYREAWPGISLLHSDGRLAVTLAADLYRGILRAIEANDFDVFRKRAHLSAGRKLVALPGVWLRARLGAGWSTQRLRLRNRPTPLAGSPGQPPEA